MDPTTHYKICPACQTPAPLTHAYCDKCGRQYRTTNPIQHQPPPVPPSRHEMELHRPVEIGHPPQYGHRTRTDLCAILSFACALVGWWILPIIFAPAAIVLSIAARHRIGESAGALKGYGYSITGGLAGMAETAYILYQWKQAGIF